MPRRYTDKTLKLLFGRANRCAFPGCSTVLVFADRGQLSVVVQIAHIRSEAPNGPRHVADYEDFNSEENLLLLCGEHHKPVDDHESVYTIDELLEWKQRQAAEQTRLDLTDELLNKVVEHLEHLADLMPFNPRMRGRAEVLDIATREGRARRTARLAPFVPEDRRAAVVEWMEGLDDPITEVPIGCLRVLVAQLGAGKSEQASRWWEEGLQAAKDSEDHEIPLYFTARGVINDLTESVVTRLGKDPTGTCRVVIDELDGVSAADAACILDEARQLVHVWPQVSVLATARPGIALPPEERIDLSPWRPERGDELVQLVLGDRLPHHLWTAETADLLTSPLTTLALASRVDAGRDTTVSRSQLLADLARQVVESPGHEASEETWRDLELLAVALLEQPHIAKIDQFRPRPRLRRMVATGLVVERTGELTFALPVFEQYFGSEAISSGVVDLQTVAAPESFPRWRYALAFAISTAVPPSRQENLLIELAKINPAATFWILDEIASNDRKSFKGLSDAEVAAFLKRRDPGGSSEPDLATRAGRWLREAEKALAQGLGPLAKSLLPHHDGVPAHWGVWLGEGRITVARAHHTASIPEITVLNEPHPCLSKGWYSRANFSFPATDFGRWRHAQEMLQAKLGTAIKNRTLAVPASSWLAGERAYLLGTFVQDYGVSRRSRVVNVSGLRRKIAAWLQEVAGCEGASWESSGRVIHLDDLHWLEGWLALQDSETLQPPWPDGDLQPITRRWYWQAYSPELTAVIAENMLREALIGYRELVECNFPAFGNAMGLYCQFPIHAEALVGRFADDNLTNVVMNLRFHTDLSPTDHRVPSVDVTMVTDPHSSAYEEFAERLQPSTRNVFYQVEQEAFVLRLSDDRAATTLAYKWLAHDLRTVGWLK
ncbi:hypothetical protein [Lentzea kentuckyensis]|uniref:hypothetical protein n=1 Tax=Lentzea kentuckyensis TaxID=360086 RepID=UPI0011798E81|nr:hypothetical protein [Lentzea kentuckyensis]